MLIVLLATSVSMLFSGCERCPPGEKLLGQDICLFYNTPVWELAQAVEDENSGLIRSLVQRDDFVLLSFQEPRFGQSLLQWAVRTNHFASVKVLAELGAAPNLQSFDDTSALIHAAYKADDADYLKLLIENGGDVNARAISKNGQFERFETPLIAATKQIRQNVDILLNAGADPSYYTPNQQTAWKSAATLKKKDIVNLLIIEYEAEFRYSTGVNVAGDRIDIGYTLRRMRFKLNSPEYKEKMKLVAFLEQHGVDYCSTPTPRHYFEIHDSSYLSKY